MAPELILAAIKSLSDATVAITNAVNNHQSMMFQHMTPEQKKEFIDGYLLDMKRFRALFGWIGDLAIAAQEAAKTKSNTPPAPRPLPTN